MPDPTDSMDSGATVAKIMAPFHQALVASAFADAVELGVQVAFDLDNPFVQTVLDRLAKQVKNVADTTKDDIRRLTGQAADEGWSIDQLQQAIRAKGAIASVSRATTIARTESGTAYNLGGVAAYRAGGVTHVDVLDGDDDEPCASANGSRWTLEQADANPLGHPNCTRAFAPVVET